MNIIDIVKSKFEEALYQVFIEKITPNINEIVIEHDGEEYILILGKKDALLREGGFVKKLISQS